MGVYINMEMPKETYAHCMLIKDIDGSVQLHVCTKNSEDVSEWEFYDLVPVPPHGRLIDVKSLENMHFTESMYDAESKLFVPFVEVASAIFDAPSIIPAEEGET